MASPPIVSRSSSSHTLEKFPIDAKPNRQKAAKHMLYSAIALVALAVFALSTAALIATAGFMFYIHVGVPDGIYLLATALFTAGVSVWAAKKLYMHSKMAYLNASPIKSPAPLAATAA